MKSKNNLALVCKLVQYEIECNGLENFRNHYS